MRTIDSAIQNGPLLFDGAMGTFYLSRFPDGDRRCERANLAFPERVEGIHREYLSAGAKAIKTNTFGANTASLECGPDQVRAIIRAGFDIAVKAAGEKAFVFADVGPLPEDGRDTLPEYRAIADAFLQAGAKHFLFETFASLERLLPTVRYIREKAPDAFILTSFAVSPDGYTREGQPAARLILAAQKEPAIDAMGFNCISGPSHLLRLVKGLPRLSKPLSVMPNSGYPTVVGGRTYFKNDPDYFAGRLAETFDAGASILGGCCGTDPDYIRKTAALLSAAALKQPPEAAASPAFVPQRTPNRFLEKLERGEKVIAVEIDPPVDADFSFFMEAARRVRDLGADAVTVSDCPVARVRADSSMMAVKLKRELGIDPIPHIACRDRNLNAIRALLLGLSMEEVGNVLVITGDPVPTAERDEVKAVFSFHSVKLADYVKSLGEEVLNRPFHIMGALNVNAPNFDAELKKALRKKENGVTTLLTQPVFTDQAAKNLHRAKEETGLRILGGILPAVSYKNALFMQHEISGITLPEELILRYKDTTREEAARLGVEVSLKTAQKIAPDVDGYYLMTPFKRIDLTEEIIRGIRRL